MNSIAVNFAELMENSSLEFELFDFSSVSIDLNYSPRISFSVRKFSKLSTCSSICKANNHLGSH